METTNTYNGKIKIFRTLIILLIFGLIFNLSVGAIPNPAAVYCGETGGTISVINDPEGQRGLCTVDNITCDEWQYFCKCEPEPEWCWSDNFTCDIPCIDLSCKEEGEDTMVIYECCEGLNPIPPTYVYEPDCRIEMTGWTSVCSNCGNGVCESWENKCNCPQDCAAQPTCRNESYVCTIDDIPCCSGLKEVPFAGESNGVCYAATCGSICRPCGNGICDENENRCSCPEDCPLDCTCSTCDECEEKLNNSACTVVNLTSDIINYSGTCIDNPENFNNKVFDCQGHTIDGNYSYGVDSEPNIGIILFNKTNNMIKNCVFHDLEGGIVGLFFNSSIINNTGARITLLGDYNDIINNRVNSNDGSGIQLTGDHNNIENNTANSGYNGIFLAGNYNNLTNNIANNNNESGIIFGGSNNNLINNIAVNNSYGIYLAIHDLWWTWSEYIEEPLHYELEIENNTIQENEFSNNYVGIYLYDSNFNEILNNEILNNVQTGIMLSGCHSSGLWCPGGNANNTIWENNISNNNIGIQSENSSSIINSNYVCNNINLDFNSPDWLSSSGNNNYCDNADGWNDTGAVGGGCRYSCSLQPKLDIEKWASYPYPGPEGTVTYNVRVRNTGTATATAVHVADSLQNDGDGGYLNYTANFSDCQDNRTIGNKPLDGDTSFNATLPDLAGAWNGNGEYCEFSYVVDIEEDLDDSMYANTAKVTGTDLDNTTLKSDEDEAYLVNIYHMSALSLEVERISPEDGDVEVNEEVIYNVTVWNQGNTPFISLDCWDEIDDSFQTLTALDDAALEAVTENDVVSVQPVFKPTSDTPEGMSIYEVFCIANDLNGNIEKVTDVGYVYVSPCITPHDNMYINQDTVLCKNFYNINDSNPDGVIIINASNFVLDCNNATINGDGNGVGIHNEFDNVTIRNCNIINYGNGISLESASNCDINNNQVISNNAYGIALYHYSNNNMIRNNFANSKYKGKGGIYLQGGSYNNFINNNTATLNYVGISMYESPDNMILDNTATSNLHSGIDVYYNSHNNKILSNNLKNNNYGIKIELSNNTEIYGNMVCSNNASDFNLTNSYNNSGDNNTCYKADGWNDAGISGCRNHCEHHDCVIVQDDLYINGDTVLCKGVYNIDDANIYGDGVIKINADNVILDCNGSMLRGNGAGTGIAINSHNNITIKNCIIKNYTKGIYFKSSSESLILNNIITDTFHGIYLYLSSNDNLIINNTAIYNTRGIFILESSNNKIVHNNVSYNKNHGIYLQSSDETNITNNDVHNNTLGGIHVDSSNNSRIYINRINSNQNGILLWDSYNSTITSNSVNLNVYRGIYLINADNSIITNNTVKLSNQGIEIGSSGFPYDSNNNKIVLNKVCSNNIDFYTWGGVNSGDNNTCDSADGWSDTGTSGCTYSCDKQPTVCKDSDGGKNYYVKGIANGKRVSNGEISFGYFEDKCVKKINENPLELTDVYSCAGENCGVSEYYCDFFELQNEMRVFSLDFVQCPNGCEDGACIQKPITLPDLTVTDLTLSNENQKAGEEVTITATIENIGGNCENPDTSDDGLVAYWSFDNVSGNIAPDEAGDNDGTIYGTNVVDGVSGNALEFDGIDDSVKIHDDDSLDITDEITIEAWVKPSSQFTESMRESGDGGYSPTIFSKHIGVTPGAQYQMGLRNNGSGYKMRFCAEPNVGSVCPMGNNTVKTDEWNYLVITFDGNKVKYYLDGVKDKEINMGGPLTTYSANLAIGATPYNAWHFKGAIDEVKIYNRALTEDEIKANYNKIEDDGLVAYWSFDDISGNIALDEAGDNNGTIYGANVVDGISGKALEFDGTDDYVDVGNNVINTNVFSFSLWFKTDNDKYGQTLIGNYVSCSFSGTGFTLIIYGSEAQSDPRLQLYNGGHITATDHEMMYDNKWHHAVGVFNENEFSLYVDGVLIETENESYNNASESMKIAMANYIGSYCGNGKGSYYKGIIDEVKIYNRALTEDEIKADYNEIKNIQNSCINSNLNNINVSLYIDGNYKDSRLLDLSEINSKKVNFSWTAESGSHDIGLVVDPDDEIYESNENNNKIYKEIVVGSLQNQNISIHKYSSKNMVCYNDYVDYTIVINKNISLMQPRELKDYLPAGLEYVPGYSYIGGMESEPAVTGNLASGYTLAWNLSDIFWYFTPLDSVEIKYKTRVKNIDMVVINHAHFYYSDYLQCPSCILEVHNSNVIGKYPGCSSQESFTLEFDEGWNLISIPLEPVNTSINAVMASIKGKYSKVFAYNNRWTYYALVDGWESGDISTIEAGNGYWVFMDEAANLTVTGNEIQSAEIILNEGWSLIGWSSTTQANISEALASIDESCDKLFTYDAKSGWSYRARYDDGSWHGTLTQMEPGKGLWVHMKEAGVLQVQ